MRFDGSWTSASKRSHPTRFRIQEREWRRRTESPAPQKRENPWLAFPVRSPALAVQRLDVLIGFVVVSEPQLHRIPLQFAFHTEGDYSHHDPLGERTGNREIGACRIAALAGADPVAIMTRGPRQERRRETIAFHLFDRQQAGVLT